MNVKHFMTKDVVTITKDTRVTDAVDIMERNDFHRLPVIENDQYVGIVTEEEIAENSPSSATSLSIYEMNYLFDKMTAGEVMSKEQITIGTNTVLEEAATIMNQENVTVLPVLNDAKQVVGILTYKDIFKALIDLSGYHQAGARYLIYIEEDRVGVLADITQKLAASDISLSHIFVNRVDNQIEITIQTDNEEGNTTEKVLKKAGYNISRL